MESIFVYALNISFHDVSFNFTFFLYLSISKLGRYLEFIFLYLYIKSKSILPIHFIEMNRGDNCSVGHWDVSPEEF